MSNAERLLTAGEVDVNALDAFLRRFFSAAHCDFLLHHGKWWHRGNRHRLVATVGDQIAGYSAVIPAPCRIDGQHHPANWWVDLVVDPAFRGRGLQSLMDLRIKDDADLLLGFPNALAAKIHRKHGWGVCETYRSVLLPFQPHRLRPVLRAAGARGVALRTVAHMARPLGELLRQRVARYRPLSARQLANPDPEGLAEIFVRHHPPSMTTTWRDANYLKWRYFDAPYRDELAFFAGGEATPRVAAVARRRQFERGTTWKLLDLFGDLEDLEATTDLLRYLARQAARDHSVEMMAFVTLPELYGRFQAAGFVLRTTGRSCWLSSDTDLMRQLHQQPAHWSFGDSDNEEPA